MKTKFILHGGFHPGATDENNTDFYSEILKDAPDKTRILLVFFAKDKDRWEIAESRVRNEFEKVKGDNKTLSFEIAQKDLFLTQLESANIVYISGGVSKIALDTFKNIPSFENKLAGKIVSGESAGANVLSTVFYSPSTNKVFEGLGILPIKLIPHYTEDKAGKFDNTKPDLEEIFLPEYVHRVFYRDIS